MTVEEFHQQRYGGQGDEVKGGEVKGGEVKEGEVGDGENGEEEEEEESEESLKAAREWDEFKDGVCVCVCVYVCVCVCVYVCDECFNPLLPPSQLHRKQTRLGKQGKHGLNDVFLTEITVVCIYIVLNSMMSLNELISDDVVMM